MAFFLANVYSQGLTCGTSDPFCTGTTYDFPAGTTGDAEAGPYYGCLSSQPAPAWYHMKIGNPGSITIYMHSSPQFDIDFACWGPFPDPASACPAGLTSANMVDCCYCGSWEETCDIPNGQTGEYYILLITNFSRQSCNIIFSQTGGTGSTDCSILPPLVYSDSPLCVGDTLHLQAETISNATYSWSGPNGFVSTEQNPFIPNVGLVHSGDYSCIITVFSQTSPPAITTVVVNELPDAYLAGTDTTVCPGADAYMVVNLTGAGPFEIIYYDGAGYVTVAGLNGPADTIFVSPPGIATYSLTRVSDTNCTKSLSGSTFHIYNFEVPTGSLNGGATICQGDTAELLFNLTGTPPWNITYLTNGTNPQTVTTGSTPYILLVSPLTTTEYQFSQLSDSHCAGTVYGQALVIVDYPSGLLSGDNTICAGGSSQLFFDLTGYPPWSLTYTANGDSAQTVTATYSPFSVTVSPPVSTLYELTGVEDDFCTGTAGGQAMVTIHQPTGELSGISTICAGESAEILFILTGDPPWNLTYTENGGNPQTVTAYSSPYTLNVTPLITTEYYLTYFEDNSCPGIPSGEAIITVNPNPEVSAGNDKTIPNGTSTTLEGLVTGGSGSYSFHWEPADKLLNPDVMQPQTVNLNSSTLFSLTGTDNNGGCYGVDEMLVTITGGVLSGYSTASPDEICRGESSQLQAIASGGSGNYTYLWQSDPPGFGSDIQNPVVSPLETTTYYVTVNDGYNVIQANVSITVNELPLAAAGPDQVIIYGTITSLQGSANGGSGQYLFHWEPSYLLTDPDVAEPVTLNLYETTLFTLTVMDGVTGCTCSGPDAVAVLISGSALSVNPSAQPNTICSGDSTRLFSLAGGGTGLYTHSWSSDPPGFISDEPDPLVSPVVNTVYTVQVTDGFNSISGSAGVTVHPKPVVSLGNDTIICVFDTLVLDAGNEGASYIWSNGATGRYISLGTTGIGFESKLVTVTVTSPEGCESTDEMHISFDFAACNGIDDLQAPDGLRLYPNPGNGLITLVNTGNRDLFLVSAVDYLGRKIVNKRKIDFSGSQYLTFPDLSSQEDGIYLIRIESEGCLPVSIIYLLHK